MTRRLSRFRLDLLVTKVMDAFERLWWTTHGLTWEAVSPVNYSWTGQPKAPKAAISG